MQLILVLTKPLLLQYSTGDLHAIFHHDHGGGLHDAHDHGGGHDALRHGVHDHVHNRIREQQLPLHVHI